MWKKDSSIKKRLNMLLLVCLIPLTVMIVYLLSLVRQFSLRYDAVVENISKANAYNIDFKKDIDYIMYIIVANAERAEELVDTEQPHLMIEEAREVFQGLYETADADYARNRLKGILKSLNTLEDRVEEIEADALAGGSYDINMGRLDLNIRILTELIQEQIQKYIYYETTNLEALREGIRADVDQAVWMGGGIFAVILAGALFISRRIMTGITEPIRNLCEVTALAGSGDFAVRAREGSGDELAVLNASFNQMVERIGNLVEDIRVEQLNLRATELKLLQAQINPHFLYNTLETIRMKARSCRQPEIEQLVKMLARILRNNVHAGAGLVTLRHELELVESYLKIQQYRFEDRLEYAFQVEEELWELQVLPLILQPLVENSIVHGLECKEGTGHIWIRAVQEGDICRIQVEDDGLGIPEDVLRRLQESLNCQDLNRAHIGVRNVHQRLRLKYGPSCGLAIESEEGRYTRITVRVTAL